MTRPLPGHAFTSDSRLAAELAFENSVAAASRIHIVDLLADGPDVTCDGCHNTGAWPRKWSSPHGRRGGFYCDRCEALARAALAMLRTSQDTAAVLAVIGRAGP